MRRVAVAVLVLLCFLVAESFAEARWSTSARPVARVWLRAKYGLPPGFQAVMRISGPGGERRLYRIADEDGDVEFLIPESGALPGPYSWSVGVRGKQVAYGTVTLKGRTLVVPSIEFAETGIVDSVTWVGSCGPGVNLAIRDAWGRILDEDVQCVLEEPDGRFGGESASRTTEWAVARVTENLTEGVSSWYWLVNGQTVASGRFRLSGGDVELRGNKLVELSPSRLELLD